LKDCGSWEGPNGPALSGDGPKGLLCPTARVLPHISREHGFCSGTKPRVYHALSAVRCFIASCESPLDSHHASNLRCADFCSAGDCRFDPCRAGPLLSPRRWGQRKYADRSTERSVSDDQLPWLLPAPRFSASPKGSRGFPSVPRGAYIHLLSYSFPFFFKGLEVYHPLSSLQFLVGPFTGKGRASLHRAGSPFTPSLPERRLK